MAIREHTQYVLQKKSIFNEALASAILMFFNVKKSFIGSDSANSFGFGI